MKAAHAFALAFLFGLLIEPLGFALLGKAASPTLNGSTNGKPAEKLVNLLTSHDTDSSPLKAASDNSVQHNANPQGLRETTTPAWTVLVYLDGDNDLEGYAFDDLNKIEIVGSTLDCAILVYVDFKSATSQHGAGATCYYIAKDADMNTINSVVLSTPLPTEPDMGDPNTLLQFITFGQSYMPADHYLLVLWDHGGGFYGVCVDETSSNDCLLPAEIAGVLSNPAVKPIDVVAFDACLMGQLEIAYELQNDTQLVVFSEETIPDSGFPYQKFLQDLADHWYWTAATLAYNMVSRYNEAYAAGGIYYNALRPDTDICLSAVNVSRTAQVARALDDLADSFLISTRLRSNYESICAARGATQSFSWPDFMDLGDFALQLQTVLASGTLADLSQALRQAVVAAVYCEQHLPGLPGATGLGLAFSTHHAIPLGLLANTSYEEFIRTFEAIGNTSANALPMSGTGTHYGYLDGKNDDVYFRYMPDTSTVHTIQLDSIQVYDEDFDLYLYDSGLNELRASEGYTSTELIEYNFVASEIYYVRVHSYASSHIDYGLGAFRLTVLQASWIDPVLLALLIITIIVIILVVVCAVAAQQGRLRQWQRSSTYTRQSTLATGTPSPVPPSTSNTGFCTNCGAPLPTGVQRCPSCGHESEQ